MEKLKHPLLATSVEELRHSSVTVSAEYSAMGSREMKVINVYFYFSTKNRDISGCCYLNMVYWLAFNGTYCTKTSFRDVSN